MRIRFFKPFDELSGKEEIILELKRPIRVKELLGEIEKRVPSSNLMSRKNKTKF